jgi:flagellar motor switch protein FliG
MGMQKLLQEIDENDLLMALKASTDDIKNKIFKNMSERRRQSIQDDLETMPPVRLKDVQTAQGRILDTAKEMIQSGVIEIVRDAVQEIFV